MLSQERVDQKIREGRASIGRLLAEVKGQVERAMMIEMDAEGALEALEDLLTDLSLDIDVVAHQGTRLQALAEVRDAR